MYFQTMAHVTNHSKEIETTLARFALNTDKTKASKLQKYIGTQLKTHGLTSAVQNQIHKVGFSFYSDNYEETFKYYSDIYVKSKCFEEKNLAFIYLDKNYKHINSSLLLQILPTWVTSVDNWAHSDSLSKFLTRLLEDPSNQKDILKIIKQWNCSPNLWERRQSLVSLYYYTRTKKKCVDYKTSERLISNLLSDKEYYVQKAVGWALRESFNAYPNETFIFIEASIRNISSTAFTTCIEKMTSNQKEILKAKRKK